jgi:hypothetical protein
MKINEIKVIGQREQSSMSGGCWQEFLVLEKLSDQEILLDIRIWECLGEIGELGFEEEEDGELIVPEKVNGKYIGEIQDGFVYGGELMRGGSEAGEIKLTRSGQDKLICWLKNVDWYEADVVEKVDEEFSS